MYWILAMMGLLGSFAIGGFVPVVLGVAAATLTFRLQRDRRRHHGGAAGRLR